jgi:hypothetical protein
LCAETKGDKWKSTSTSKRRGVDDLVSKDDCIYLRNIGDLLIHQAQDTFFFWLQILKSEST